ncbi:TlpA family protein disulfide reductase [Mucilaginibacter arboris]|nr:TlpA disulfide reductase family protein [Mucilaginibacter arboris]
MDTQPFNNDKNPERVIAAINKQYLLNKGLLANYIKANKPSTAFIKNAMINLKYFAPANYYEFSHNHTLFKSKEELKPWLKIQDSLFKTIKLSNDEALNAYNYTELIYNFMFRETEALEIEYQKQPAVFYKQWFHTNPAKGDSTYKSWYLGVITKKVVDKYFTGKAAEYAYVRALKYRFSRADYPAVVSIFNYFKKEYPHSAYVKGFSPTIAELVKKQQQTFSKATIFVKNNGTRLNTFKDVLALTKGKVALIDMWGTWCTPCREEIEKNALKLETYFKGKNVNFIYIANFDVGREKEWKKAIAYFQIEGMQILANPALTKDIMDKVKSTGYPTYIIINKDGSYRKTATQHPVNVQAMIKEIEIANLQ